MSTAPMIDDDGNVVRHDYRSRIDVATRARNYKANSTGDLYELNWKLNQIETNWGDHAARTRASRATLVPTAALLALRDNIKTLRNTWATIQNHQAAGRILFADAITKTGRDEVLFSLDSVFTSPDLTAVLSDLTPHRLRKRLPSASGPIPIAPLVPDLVLLPKSLESRLEPVAHTKRVRTVASLSVRCDIASRMLKVTNETQRKLGNQLTQGGAFDDRAYECGLACLIHAMHRKDVLGEVNSNGYDNHNFPPSR